MDDHVYVLRIGGEWYGPLSLEDCYTLLADVDHKDWHRTQLTVPPWSMLPRLSSVVDNLMSGIMDDLRHRVLGSSNG